MRPVRTESTNTTLKLPGGDESNDLPARVGRHAGSDGIVEAGDPAYHAPYIATIWEPDPAERAALSAGANIELVLWTGSPPPPVALGVNREPILGEPLSIVPGPSLWFEVGPELAKDLAAMLGALDKAEPPDDPAVHDRFQRLAELRFALAGGLAHLESEAPG